MRVLFALFAEDIKLLPAESMSPSIKQAIFKPQEFVGQARASPGRRARSRTTMRAWRQSPRPRELVRLRDNWLAGDGRPELPLTQHTLTNLCDKCPGWLHQSHKRRDAAVFGAYGWPRDLSDDEILARLLALNLERAKGWGEAPPAAGAEGDEEEAEG